MKNKFIIIWLYICSIVFTGMAAEYYVRTDGSNSNAGTGNSSTEAWKTLSFAFSKIKGGDHLYIADGLYKTNPLTLRNVHGTEENPTIISAINIWGPQITLQGSPEWGNTLVAENCSYLIIDGLEVFQDAPTKGTGIQASHKSHHITIRNCYVHDCGCNGISARGSDYVTVEKNIVKGNATRSEYNCSGISFFLPAEHDREPGYHFIVRQNVAFENECRLPFRPGGHDTPTDGNGIIMDLFNNTYNDDEGEPGGYTNSTLIENNLSFNNGGRGIHLFRSNNVTVRNNTCWHNLYVLSEYGQYMADLESFSSSNVKFVNNITVKNPTQNTQALRMYEVGDSGSFSLNNIIIGGKDYWPTSPTVGGNQIKRTSDQDYPQFINATTDVSFESRNDFQYYFSLSQNSPAIDRANADDYSDVDLLGNSRPIGDGADIGCFENSGSTRINGNNQIIKSGELLQNYPNPFNPATIINYFVTKEIQHVKLDVYNINAQHITTLVDEFQHTGEYSVIFDAKFLQSGLYFLMLQTDNLKTVKKISLVK